MAEEEVTDAKGKKKKKSDYAEVEFEIGNIEFEAKGRSVVVERMFRLLLEKIEEGKLVTEFKLQDVEEEEGEEKEEEVLPPDTLGDVEEKDEEPIPLPAGDTEPTLDPPPAWDTLETDEPEVSEAEKEEFDL
ncbi:MAG: hypothetical protein ACTSSE_15225 [Candidatus Thorarchaeota archaeon]